MKNILIFLFLILSSCLEKEISLSLLPNTIEKSINRFNYCLNHINEPQIFYTIDEVLTGKALEEFKELQELIAYTEQGKVPGYSNSNSKSYSLKLNTLKNELEQYVSRASALKIRIVKITKADNAAKVLCYYYDTTHITESKKKLFMKLEDRIWKIFKITDLNINK